MYRDQVERNGHVSVPIWAGPWVQALVSGVLGCGAAVCADVSEEPRDAGVTAEGGTCVARVEEAAVGCGVEAAKAEAEAVPALAEVDSWGCRMSDARLLCTRGSEVGALQWHTGIAPVRVAVHAAAKAGAGVGGYRWRRAVAYRCIH